MGIEVGAHYQFPDLLDQQNHLPVAIVDFLIFIRTHEKDARIVITKTKRSKKTHVIQILGHTEQNFRYTNSKESKLPWFTLSYFAVSDN